MNKKTKNRNVVSVVCSFLKENTNTSYNELLRWYLNEFDGWPEDILQAILVLLATKYSILKKENNV